MSEDQKKGRTRQIEKTIEINVPVEAVWKALTDAQELMRWFPTDAKVEPGKGGAIWISWGPPYQGRCTIEIWEPNRHLKMRDEWAEHAHDDQKQEVEPGVPAQVAMDYYLEGAGGKTVLRLVHSGFGLGSDWDDEFDATKRGWDFELLGLKHYLEQHRGSSRQVVWARTKVQLDRQQVWDRIMSPFGILKEGSLNGSTEGSKFEIVTVGGEKLRGTVLAYNPPEDFAAIISNLNDAFFRFRIEKWSKPKHVEPNLWLSLYDLPQSDTILLQSSWTKLLTKLFPEELKQP